MKFNFSFLALLLCLNSYSQDYTKEILELWDSQSIHFNKENIALAEKVDSTGRRITQISVPKLYVYRKAKVTGKGSALLYIPGGGYAVVALRDDGKPIAERFLEMGFDLVAVLKYRLPDERIVDFPRKVPLCDAQKALSLIHRNSDKWSVNQHKIAVMGSSAGGHLAASLANLTDEIIAPGVKPEELEQAVSILRYPVISFNLPYRHQGSYKHLLGEKHEDKSLLDYYSMENQVSRNTPPTYLIHAKDDVSVPYQNSVIYMKSLKELNIPYGYQLLEKGGHGFGFDFAKTGVDWTVQLEEWLRENTKLFSAQFQPNYNEANIPDFMVPNPLKTFTGKKIRNAKTWMNKRRPELLDFFTENVYGEVPGELKIDSYKVIEQSDNALNGNARKKQVNLTFKKNGRTLDFTILIYLPKTVEKAPLFVGYNFYGNHTITNDSDVIISDSWTRNNESFGIINHHITKQSRGVRTDRWPIQRIIDSGFGLATIFYCEVDPDKDDFSDGVHPFFYVNDQQQPAGGEWGSIAAWAWGLRRAMDYFEEDNDIDESKVVVFGHSRLGKTSLWAGATEQRFAGVISNDSGCGGAAMSKRKFGETVASINTKFPHWFCKNFRNYNNNEEALPVDQHELLALIAPRPLYVASAEKDQWADPRGEFLSAYYAGPVYELFGEKVTLPKEMPEVNHPVLNTVAYHIRTGGHGVTDYDWEQYIKWAKEQVLK